MKIKTPILATLLLVSCQTNEVKIKSKQKNLSHEVQVDTTAITQRYIMANDTFYLVKRNYPHMTTPFYEYVYRTYEPKEYLRLIPKVKNEYYSQLEPESLKIELGDIPSQWTEVIYFGNEYYLKSPSDLCWLDQKIITNSGLISMTCDGPFRNKLSKVIKLNDNQYELHFGLDEKHLSKIEITVIDRERGITIWKTDKNKYKLYADINKFKSIPIARADCNGNKCRNELESEYIDLASVVKKAF